LLMHKRYAQCRGTKFGASKIGTFACRTSLATPKHAKEPIVFPRTKKSRQGWRNFQVGISLAIRIG
ncbi:MAG: hypothetical protein OEV74_21875, partial [Cyclobacteriaceae bacterium]|nr:hypothetical protein [Cyclobacteriaceae bacterium]